LFSQAKNAPLFEQIFKSRFVRFGIVGGTGVVVNYGCYVLFHDVLGMYDLLGLVLAIEFSIINNFIWNERWTFRDRSQKGAALYVRRFLAFNLTSGIVAFSVQVLNQWIETRVFNVWDKAALMIGIILGAVLNYFVSNHLIFRGK
jgi:dolichol-phosphate mannosyltransferase